MNSGDSIDMNFSYATSVKDPQKRHAILRSAMVFPKTSTLVARTPIAKLKYTCHLGQQCKISDLISSVDGNQDFSAWGITSMLNEVVSDIHRNQKDYKPEIFDGFLIARDGQNLLHLERDGSKGDGRTGFLEYNAYRQEMMEEAKTERLIASLNTNNSKCNIC